MSGIISPGEISTGQFLTVLEWEPIVHEPDGFMTTTRTVHRDNSHKGDVLKVMATCIPFIVVERQNGYRGSPIELDTRRVKLMELTAEYVAALTKPTP